MTDRKPRGMSFPSWIDQQIADAERRGVFENLPGNGKPLNLKPTGGDYGDAWVRDYARREGVQPDEFLPTPLRLRREIEKLTEVVGEFRSEEEIREVAGDINRRIVEWRRIPVGPPIHVRLVNADDLVERWRAAKEARPPAAGPPAAGPPAVGQPAAGLTVAGVSADASGQAAKSPRAAQAGTTGRPRWWRRRRRA